MTSQDSYTNDGKILSKVLSTPSFRVTAKCEEIYGANKVSYACMQVASTLQSFSFEQNPQLKRIQNFAFYMCTSLQSIDLSPCSHLTYIGDNAFFHCTSVTSLTFPDNLNEIGAFSFSELTSLLLLFIPSSVSIIGEDCFNGCNQLSEVRFGDTSILTEIKIRVFTYAAITSFEFPAGLKSIKCSCFFRCSNIKSVTIHPNNKNFKSDGKTVYANNNKTLVYCASNIGTTFEVPNFVERIDFAAFISSRLQKIVLPNTITYIDTFGFAYNGALNQINLPDSITYIGSASFSSCYGLKTITLPRKITTITGGLFANSALTEIRFPENITTVGDNAFSGCRNLMDVYLNEKLQKLGGGVFSNCPTNMRYHFDENSQFKLNDQMLLIDNDETYISQYLGSSEKIITIPSTVETIKSRAFYQKTNIVSIRCDTTSNLKYIHEEAFSGCINLQEFDLFSNIITIRNDCFLNTSITSIISFSGSLTNIGDNAFKNTKIRSVSIASSSIQSKRFSLSTPQVTIGNSAFEGCTELTTFEIPTSTTVSYGDYCFMNCIYLESFYISSNVLSYGNGCFMNSSISSISFENDRTVIDNLPINCFKDCQNLENFVIPTNVQIINSQSLSRTSIRSIFIPDFVHTLSSECFMNCIYLESVNINDASQLSSIENGVFSGCSRFSTIPNFISRFMCVENGALYSIDRTELYVFPPASPYKFLSLPDRLRTIGQSAFIGCKNLDSILIPDNSVRSIGKSAFSGCSNLRMINIPLCVESIGLGAFHGCDHLHCGLSIENKTKTFISLLVSSGLPLKCIRECSSFTCRMIHYNKDLHLSYLFPIIII